MRFNDLPGSEWGVELMEKFPEPNDPTEKAVPRSVSPREDTRPATWSPWSSARPLDRKPNTMNLLHNPQGNQPDPGKPLKGELVPWNPRPVERPTVAPDLVRMDPVVRSAEVLRYSVRRTEFWLSPMGGLREWFRLNLWIAILLAIPAIVIIPVASYLLTQLAAGTGQLSEIARNLAQIPGGLRTGVLIVATMAALWILRLLFR